jgi:CheY-like chemotaxis protein
MHTVVVVDDDIQRPDIDGYEVGRQPRRDSATRRIPVIPVDPAVLLDAVRRLLPTT